MADNQLENQIETNEQEVAEVVEQPAEVEQEAPKTFTQDEVNDIISRRLADERQSFSEQMAEYNRQMAERQAAIEAGISRIAGAAEPKQKLTPDQELLLSAAMPVIEQMKAQMEKSFESRLSALYPMAAQSAAQDYWSDKPNVPDEVKQAASKLFKQHYRPGANINELLEGAFTVAAADYGKRVMLGQITPQKVANKPAPRPVASHSNTSAELGNSHAPVALGGNQQLNLSWRDELAFLAEKDIWPGEEDEKLGRKRR